jgi:hypothetical protein
LALTLSGEPIKNNNSNKISMPLMKGSESAKEHMTKLRAMNKEKGKKNLYIVYIENGGLHKKQNSYL